MAVSCIRSGTLRRKGSVFNGLVLAGLNKRPRTPRRHRLRARHIILPLPTRLQHPSQIRKGQRSAHLAPLTRTLNNEKRKLPAIVPYSFFFVASAGYF